MKKSTIKSISGFILSVFIVLHLFCSPYDSPTAPQKTKATVIFKTSTSKVHEGSLIDSAGKEIWIGAALYLPVNFDSILIQVLDDVNIVVDTVFRTFRSEYFFDTVWVKHTFLKSGVKNLTITPFSDPERPVIGATITIQGDVQTAGYSVRYQKGSDVSGDLPVDSKIYQSSELVIVLGNTGNLTKSGFTFTGWNTAADGSGTAYAGGVTFPMGSDDMMLYAQWTTNPTYTVTYVGNGNTGGNVPVDVNEYEAGATVTVKDNTGSLVKTGATFTGWNTAADGSGIAYAGGVNFPMGSADVVLYAQWTTNPIYTIAYSGNGNTGGVVPVDANEYETAATVTVMDNTGSLVKTGATFTGWNTAADGSGTSYAGGVTFAMGSDDMMLYAQWTTNPTYTVTYVGNGNTVGNVPVDANEYETAVMVTVKDNAGSLVKTGAAFTGWNTAADGSGTAYAGGVTFAMGSADVMLYAQWTVNKYTVVFNSMEGSAVTSQTIEYGGKVTEPAAPALSGYTFGGWYKEMSCTTIWNFSTETITADVTLYAKWTAVIYTVTFNDQSATTQVSQTTVTVTYPATTIGTLPTEPKKTGYTFCCWNTAADGSGSEFTALTTVTANITVYAIWNSYTYTVTYDGQSVVANSTKAVTSPATTVGTLPAPTATGYQFDGWYTGANGGGLPFHAATTVTENRTVYAKWTKVCKVTYDLNTGTGTVPVDPNTYQNGNNVVVLSGSGLSKTNYTFAGWNTQADTLGTSYTGGGSFIMGSADVTLYAKWRMNVPTISTLSNKTCPINDSVKFTVTANGASPLSYKWYMNNSEVGSGASYTTSKLTAADISGPRTYKCVVSNPAGSANCSATLSVSTVNDVDNNVYHEVKMGGQIWMMENLKTTRYRDGSRLGTQSTDTTDWKYYYKAYAWPEYSQSNSGHGMLYNWNCVNGGTLPPAGWRIATEADWDTLFAAYSGCDLYDPDFFNVSIDWGCPASVEPNNTGFTAMANGMMGETGEAGSFYNDAYWWASETKVSHMYFSRSWSMSVTDYNVAPDNGYGIRCIKGE